MIKRDIKEKAIEDMIENEILDIRTRLIRITYGIEVPDKDAEIRERATLAEEVQEPLGRLNTFIGDKKFLTGDELSYVDFLGYEYLDWYREIVQSNVFDDHPNIQRFFKNFEEIPALKNYLANQKYRRAGILSPFANWGYDRE